MKPIPSVEQMWLNFAHQVRVPPGGIQWNETRRAFFAGALSILTTMNAQVAELEEEQGAAQLQGWLDEIKVDARAFARSHGLEPNF